MATISADPHGRGGGKYMAGKGSVFRTARAQFLARAYWMRIWKEKCRVRGRYLLVVNQEPPQDPP